MPPTANGTNLSDVLFHCLSKRSQLQLVSLQHKTQFPVALEALGYLFVTEEKRH